MNLFISSFGITAWQLWLTACLVLFILELFTSGFILVCFAVGSFTACIFALFGLSVEWQIIIFSISTVLSLVFVRPFIIKISSNKQEIPSGMDAIVGRLVMVYEDIDPIKHTGSISCDGDVWKAQTIDNEFVAKGDIVKIISYNSLVLTVKKINN